MAACAAICPGAPMTPPPGCAPLPQMSRFLTGVNGGDKSKSVNITDPNVETTHEPSRRRLSISRSGRFKEQKRRGVITESTFSGANGDEPNSKERTSSNGNHNEVSKASEVRSGQAFGNEQWESVNEATVSYTQKKEAAAKAVASKGRKETSI
ncbi:hypothetical protein C0J52_01163 [Blattella germanica]|nr:hypothetical protein C0J52_01163 [Blattella germanica]